MSEELKANNYTKKGNPFGVYESYTIGATTINELKKYKIVPNKEYGEYGKRKPDGLIVDRRNKDDIKVIAVIEYKDPTDFNTQEKKDKALQQCNNYCQLLNATFGIATDTKEYYYINPKSNKEDDIKYFDDFGTERRYSLIQNEDGYFLSHNLVKDLTNLTELNKTLAIFDRIQKEITGANSKLISEKKLNPNNLAKNVWQSIWLASGENPDKCLSTFVEIFIFKYLSDLEILQKNADGVPVDFDSVKGSGKNLCLKYYFKNVREYVKTLFPESSFDNTSIINGFILDPRVEEHNNLFYNILTSFSDFLVNENGDPIKLVNIDPEFKSRLYEDFLKRSMSQKNWGQFFTPRNVIKAIIEVSGIEKLPVGSIVGDPASGVGGFLLEPLLTKITSEFQVKNSKLISNLTFEGCDRDPKVIIMAKSNMIIYLSELLRDNPTLTKEFAESVNSIFKSYHTSILGSLSVTRRNHFDLIMTNPPYVTKGIVNYKEAISNNGALKDYYYVNGMGVECFFMEKIINELKPNGKAFIVIPDGLLNRVNDYKLREYIKKTCIIDGIISLPIGTFYSTQKKTYILAITKKEDENIIQTDNVFGYIVTTVGESLDVYRVQEEDNDLKDFVRQFKYFMLDKKLFQPLNIHCKTFPIAKFAPKTNWCVDAWWEKEYKIELGIEEEINIVDIDEYHNQVKRVNEEVTQLNSQLENIDRTIASLKPETETYTLQELFDIKQGDAYYTLKRIKENGWEGTIPVFSSNTKQNGILAYIKKEEIKKKDRFYDYSLTWAIDGMAGQLFLRNEENRSHSTEDKYLFTLNNHCGLLLPKEKIEFSLSEYLKNKTNLKALTTFFEELEQAEKEVSKHNKEHLELMKKISEFTTYFTIIIPANKIELTKYINHTICADILVDDETIVKRKTILTEEIIEKIIDNKIETVKMHSILIVKGETFASIIKKLKVVFKELTDDGFKFFRKDLLPLLCQFYNNRIEIDLGYVMKNIQPLFFQRTRSYGNKKLGSNQIEDIEILIPIKNDKTFDILTMESISKEQDKLKNIKDEIISKYTELGKMEVIMQ